MRRMITALLVISLICGNAAALEYKTKTTVNLRAGPSTSYGIVTKLNADLAVTMLAYDAEGWSKVSVRGSEGYIRSDLLKIIEESGSTAAPATPIAGSAGIYKTTVRVNYRAEPGTSAAILGRVAAGTEVEVSEHNIDGWSAVRYNGQEGYISSQYLSLVSLRSDESTNESPVSTEVNAPAPPVNTLVKTAAEEIKVICTTARVNFRSGPSTGDAVITILAAGTAVDVLGEQDGWTQVSYQEQTGFIKSEYLREYTQSGAVSPGGVEYMQWSSMKNEGVIPLNTPLQITDVRSGLVYTVQSFSNGNHADVEPKTQADTALLKQSYGGVWSWTPRPVWVTVNGRSFAGSINGMPHGGGVISGNGMDGQICLHFPGSSTHNGNTAFTAQHAAATEEAWTAAKNLA